MFMKLYKVVVHYLQMCMKEYNFCPNFGRGDNSTFVRKGVRCPYEAQFLLNGLLDFYKTLLGCSTLFADVNEGIWLLSKVWKGDN